MSKATHVATYPIYGTNPITGGVWNRRVGTGYIYKFAQIADERSRLNRYGHPFKLRWRNEECRADYFAWLEELPQVAS